MSNVIAPNHLLLALVRKLLNRFKCGVQSLALLVLTGHARLAQMGLSRTLIANVRVISAAVDVLGDIAEQVIGIRRLAVVYVMPVRPL